MKRSLMMMATATAATLGLVASAAYAADYRDTTAEFKHAHQSASFFKHSYAYAIFPTIGEAGFIVGGAHGRGKVYEHGVEVGNTAVTQLSVGWQAGGQAYSEIIFFQDKNALDKFESGSFQFGAGASVVVITAGAAADIGNQGGSAAANVDSQADADAGAYLNGMAVFTLVKGGLMANASLEGEKFSYTPRDRT
jgi:lipid-binding SYLF domain-containing protein